MSQASIGIRVFMEDAASAGLYAINGALGRMAGLGRGAAAGLGAITAVTGGVFLGAAAALAVFVAGIIYSIKQFSDLQQAMLRVQIATGATSAQMQQLQGFMIQLGGASIYSLDALSQGMAVLAQYGFKTVAALEQVTTAGVNLGEALNVGPTEAFTLLGKIMRDFSLPASQAQRTADMLFYSFQHGTNNVDQLEAGFAQLGGLASVLHISLADLIPPMDLLSPIMGSAATAGNSLYFGLARLVNPTKSEADLQKQLGLSFFDSTGHFIGFNQAVTELYNTLKDKSPAEQFKILSDLMSVRGAKAFELLIAKYKDYEKAVKQFQKDNQGAGASTDAAAKVMATLGSQLQVLKTNIQDTAALIGSALAPMLSVLLGLLNPLVVGLRNLALSNGQAIASFLLLGAAIAGIVLLVLLFGTGLGEIIGVALLVFAAIVGLGLAILGLVKAIQQGMSAQNAMGAILRALGAAFSALGTWIHGTVIPALQRLWDWLEPRLGAAFSNLGHIMNDVVAPAIVRLAGWLQQHLGPAFSALGSFIHDKVIPGLQALWKWIQQNVIPAIQALWAWAQTILIPALSTLWATIQTKLVPALQQLWQVISTQIIPVLQQFWMWLQNNVLPALQRFGSWVVQNTPLLKALALIIAGPLVAAFALLVLILGIVILVLALVVAALAGVIALFTLLAQVVGAASSAIGTFVHNTIATITSWGTTIGTAISGAINWFKKLPDEVQGIIQRFVDMVLGWFRRLAQQLVGGSIVPDMINAIVRWFGRLPGMIGGAISTFVSTVVQGMQNAFSRGLAAVVTGVSNIVSQVATLPGRAIGALAGLAGMMFSSGANAMASFASGLGSMLGAVISKVQAAASIVAGFMSHHSPPKEGPMKDDDQWMPNMMKMFAQGVEAGAPQLRLAFGNAVSGLSSISSPVGYSGTGVGTTTINLMLDGKVLGQVVMNRLTGQLQSNGLGRAFK